MLRPSTVLRISALCLALFTCAHPLHAEKLNPFDIVAISYEGHVFKIDPTTGVQQIISTDGLHPNPSSMKIHDDGTIVLINDNQDFETFTQDVILLNPDTGNQTYLTSSAEIFNLDVNQSGIYLLSQNQLNHIPAGQSSPQLISQTGLLHYATGIAVDNQNSIFITDISQLDDNFSYTLHVNPFDGAQTVLTTGGIAGSAIDHVLTPDNRSLLTISNNNIIQIDIANGNQTHIASLNYLSDGLPLDFINPTLDPRGHLLTTPTTYTPSDAPNPLISVDLETGTQQILSTGGFLTENIFDLEVFIPYPADADVDGIVDLRDLAILATFFGQTQNQTWSSGDFTHDGIVDLRDLAVLATFFGQTSTSLYPQTAPPPSQTTSIPEPSTFTIILLTCTAMTRRRNNQLTTNCKQTRSVH